MSNSDITKLRILSELVSRSALSARLGKSFSGARDLYEVCGHKRDIQFEDYWNQFERNGIGKRIIVAPVTSTWYGEVGIWEDQKPSETPFEKAWSDLDEKLKLIAKLVRLDILAGIGKYGVLLLGFDDAATMDQPLQGKANLLYVQPYHENSAQIVEWDTNPKSPRYGKPVYYSISPRSLSRGEPTGTISIKVHFTRIIHVAEGALENDVYGVPRLQASFNRVEDIEKIASGSAEMFWQGALGGKAFKAAQGATFDPTDMENLESEIDEYIHGLRRYLRLQNMDIQDLAPQVVDPSSHVGIQLDLIAGDTGIPKRILVGSERGDLASSQDEGNWNSRVQQRRDQFAAPFILRVLIDKLIATGNLPAPADSYQIHWADLSSMGDKDRANIALVKSQALAAYVSAPGAEMVVPEEFFLSDVLDFTDDQVERIKKLRADTPISTPVSEPAPIPNPIDQGGDINHPAGV